MPHATTKDGVQLYYEETGTGEPLIFVHEFAGDHRSWVRQIEHFAGRYRCIVFNARGYPPSDVPDDLARYSQSLARDDVLAVLDHLEVARAHIVGLSMGGFAALHIGLAAPDRALSLVVGGCGYGAEPGERERFRTEVEAAAVGFETQEMQVFADIYATAPTRVQLQNKDPQGWREFADQLGEHSAVGAAMTMRGVQKERPSLWELETEMTALTVPTLILVGDEDDPCLAPALFMKRTIPTAGLVAIPNTGHTVNLEEPEAFNRAIADFLDRVAAGRWGPRDPRSQTGSILGTK